MVTSRYCLESPLHFRTLTGITALEYAIFTTKFTDTFATTLIGTLSASGAVASAFRTMCPLLRAAQQRLLLPSDERHAAAAGVLPYTRPRCRSMTSSDTPLS